MKDKIYLHLITGSAGVGKTTFANELQNNISGNIVSIATPIKAMALMRGWSGEKDEEGRSLLQLLGRKGRELNYNIWVNYVLYDIFTAIELEDIKGHRKKKYNFIIPDVRFDDEVRFFIDIFGKDKIKVYKIDRKGYKSTLTKEQQNDITEQGVSEEYIDEHVYLKGVK